MNTTDGTSYPARRRPDGRAAAWWRAGNRRWLAVAGLVLAVVCLLPPVSSLAGRYVVAETVQFAVFAMIVPALLVLAGPWWPHRLAGLVGRPARHQPATRRPPSVIRPAGLLALFAVCAAAWRLPVTVDAVARHQGLAVAELATLLIAGSALWLELVPPGPPRRPGWPVAVLAACAMWVIWIIAYIMGMATRGVFHAFRYVPGGPLSAVADQELATAVLWGVAAVCFIPVVFLAAFSWLHEGEGETAGVDAELERMTSGSALPPVRGWGHPQRRPDRG